MSAKEYYRTFKPTDREIRERLRLEQERQREPVLPCMCGYSQKIHEAKSNR